MQLSFAGWFVHGTQSRRGHALSDSDLTRLSEGLLTVGRVIYLPTENLEDKYPPHDQNPIKKVMKN